MTLGLARVFRNIDARELDLGLLILGLVGGGAEGGKCELYVLFICLGDLGGVRDEGKEGMIVDDKSLLALGLKGLRERETVELCRTV